MATAKKQKETPVAQEADIGTGTALIPLEVIKAHEIFAPNGTKKWIAIVETEVAGFSADVTTEEGRKAIWHMDRRIASSKNAIDKLRTEFTEARRKEIEGINAEGKLFTTRMKELQDQVSAPLDAWKKAEQDRVAILNERLTSLRHCGEVFGEQSSLELRGKKDLAKEIFSPEDGFDWQDFMDLAAETYNDVCNNLDQLLPQAIKRESDAEELRVLREQQAENLRKKQAEEAAAKARTDAEKIAADKIEADRKAAEDRVKAEGERAAKAELEATQAKEREKQALADAETAKANAAKQAADAAAAATKAEEERQQKIADDKAEEEKRLAADKEHRGKINKAALAAIMGAAPISEAMGIAILTAIVKGKVPQVSIAYTVKE